MDTLELLDLTVLDQAWDAAHCVSSHRAPISVPCSHTPVARLLTCAGDFAICENLALRDEMLIVTRASNCATCGRPVEECWQVVSL